MLRHGDIWRAIDTLAEQNGLSTSALARRSGLDPTTFNKSKRVMRDGKLRWPSTESVSKMLRAIDCSLADFVAIVGGPEQGLSQRVPVIGYAQAGDVLASGPPGTPLLTHLPPRATELCAIALLPRPCGAAAAVGTGFPRGLRISFLVRPGVLYKKMFPC